MATCTNCGMAIGDPDRAIHDGEHWFCTHQCLGQWEINQPDGAPV